MLCLLSAGGKLDKGKFFRIRCCNKIIEIFIMSPEPNFIPVQDLLSLFLPGTSQNIPLDIQIRGECA